jgi:hypothetical protein
MSLKNCEWCGIQFKPARPYQKYCSKRCKLDTKLAKDSSDRYYPGISALTKTCTCCGKEFRLPAARTSPSGNFFCSKICDKRWRRHPIPRAEPLPNRKHLAAADAMQNKLARQNARQAWQYWLKEKAPDNWLDRYYPHTDKPWRDHRLSNAERYRLRYQLDLGFQIQERLRRQLKKRGVNERIAGQIRAAIRKGCDSPTIKSTIGYSIEELIAHLDRMFTDGMSWERFKAGEIHIDHIIPKSLFDPTDPEQVRQCWALSNLQPLWAEDNMRKSNKVLCLL